VALDLGGHGESGKERRGWTIPALAEDVRAAIEKSGLARAVLVGHSMGGSVALEAAHLLAGRAVAVIGVETLQDVDERLMTEQKAEFLAPWRADFEGKLRRDGPGHLFRPWTDPELVRRILAEMSSAPPKSAVALLEAYLDYDQAKSLARVRVPIRLINTDQYPTNLAAARRYAPQLELTVMPLRCHFPMIEDPDEFNRLLGRAIRELAASTGAGEGARFRSGSTGSRRERSGPRRRRTGPRSPGGRSGRPARGTGG